MSEKLLYDYVEEFAKLCFSRSLLMEIFVLEVMKVLLW